MTIVEKAKKLRQKIESLALDMEDTEALEFPDLFAKWGTGKITAGDKVRYDAKLFKCLQNHTSQDDWTPDRAASLWVEISDPSVEYPDWKQPTGAHDAYNKGDKVKYENKHWVSDVDGNVWVPGVYGWSEVV